QGQTNGSDGVAPALTSLLELAVELVAEKDGDSSRLVAIHLRDDGRQLLEAVEGLRERRGLALGIDVDADRIPAGVVLRLVPERELLAVVALERQCGRRAVDEPGH